MKDLARHAGLGPSVHTWQGLGWHNTWTGENTSSIGVEIKTGDTGGWARLFYTFTAGRNKDEKMDYRVPLVTTWPHFGGLRWWFICPLSVNGHYCGRRVGKLYLPPGGRYFGCRHCYDLTYRSCQESHKWDRLHAELAAMMSEEYPGITGNDVGELLKRSYGW